MIAYDAFTKIDNAKERELWDRFWATQVEGDDRGCRCKSEKRAELEALIREMPLVLECDDEIRGLAPVFHHEHDERYLWISLMTSGEHRDCCCMADEIGAEEFDRIQRAYE